MTYFVSQKLLRAAAQVSVRGEYTTQALRATSENIYTLDRIVDSVLPLVQSQAENWLLEMGEPMPRHVHTVLETEIGHWERLRESLADYRESDPNEQDAITYAQNVRSFLYLQQDLLRLAEELLQSCLVDHYLTMTRALRRAADEVPL